MFAVRGAREIFRLVSYPMLQHLLYQRYVRWALMARGTSCVFIGARFSHTASHGITNPVKLAFLLAHIVVGNGIFETGELPEELHSQTLRKRAVIEIFRLKLLPCSLIICDERKNQRAEIQAHHYRLLKNSGEHFEEERGEEDEGQQKLNRSESPFLKSLGKY